MMNFFPTARFLVAALLVAVSASFAVDGIAISNYRPNNHMEGCGWGTDMVGNIHRHDIRASVVVKDTIIYSGRARICVINQTGDRVAFVKDLGHICVVNMNGTGFQEFTNTKNSHGSWIEWPQGDWVYYYEKTIGPPDGSFNNYSGAMEAKNLRRVNVTSGVDEFVAEFGVQTWQFGMEATANKSGGLLVSSGPLVGENGIKVNVFDISDPGTPIRRHGGCSPGISPSGDYYGHNTYSHRDMIIYNRAGDSVANIHINQYAAAGTSDGRDAGEGGWTRNRWSANSDKWVMAPHATEKICAVGNTDMVLYNWVDKEQIHVTRNHLKGSGSNEPMDFWVDQGPGSSGVAAPSFIARGAPVLQGLQLRLPGSGVYAIDIFTPRGARAGSFQINAPGAFDLSKAGLSNGLYQIRVRTGADIFWLKAPVVR